MKYSSKDLKTEEKFRIIIGEEAKTGYIDEKIDGIILRDGPCGVRNIEKDEKGNIKPTSTYPSPSVLSNTWNRKLAYLEGESIGNDAIENNVDILFGPGVNIKRTPLCGRNFEYFSEDPYLAGLMSKEYIKGLQKKGIGACLKHFALNNREHYRLVSSSECDKRTLMEIYARQFEIALEAKPYVVMCSYNQVNGVYASENKPLLDILRKKFNYKGVIMSDFGAVQSIYRSLNAGIELIMPRMEKYDKWIIEDYNNHKISDEVLNRSVDKILKLEEKCKSFNKKINYTKEERHNNAVKISLEGIVLLKNDNNILPLKRKDKVLFVGDAVRTPTINGGGSALCETSYKEKDLEKLFKNKVCDYSLDGSDVDLSKYDKVVVLINDVVAKEGEDRKSITLPKKSLDLINDITSRHNNVILGVYAGSIVDFTNIDDKVKGLLFIGYPGEGCNESLYKILSGKVSPSGKLSETIPMNIDDTYTKLDEGNGYVEDYTDRIFVGYRYYDKYNKKVRYPFGYGLSYATFKYSNLNIIKEDNGNIIISYNIENTSDIDAKEVSEVYVKDLISTVIRPERELKNFSKDLIKAHEIKLITLTLTPRDFMFYSVIKDDWYLESGEFEISIGSSSRDIKLSKIINIEKEDEYTKESTIFDRPKE